MKNKIKILIVEDEALTARFLKLELEEAGFEVIDFVGSGNEAIKLARENKPDLILMDIQLSDEINGIDAAMIICKNQEIPIIFMTGYSERNLIEQAKEANPVAFLEKPILVYELESIINKIFEDK